MDGTNRQNGVDMFAIQSLRAAQLSRLTAAVAVLSLFAFTGGTRGAEERPEEIAWRKDYGQALRDAAKLKRPVMVEIGASWCGYCRQMQEQTLTDKRVIERVNRGFVPLRIDADADSRLVRAFGPESLPTTVIISPDLKIVGRISGFRPPETFHQDLQPFDQTPVQSKARSTAAIPVADRRATPAAVNVPR